MHRFLPILVRNFFCFSKAPHFRSSFPYLCNSFTDIFFSQRKKILRDLPCPLSGMVRPMIKNLSKGYYRFKPTKALYNYDFKEKTLSCSYFISRLYIQTKQKTSFWHSSYKGKVGVQILCAGEREPQGWN